MIDFKDSYEECRENFLSLTYHASVEHIKIPSSVDNDLFIDVAFFPSISKKKEKLIIMTSGVHGVEGFVGSAMQSFFMKSSEFQNRDPRLSFLFIHGINPFGFKHKRRVTESNVDLNRNFDTDPKLFTNKNPSYQKVYKLLNPKYDLKQTAFIFKTLHAILLHSMESLRRGMLSGQYEFPEGIFFGGQKFEPQKEIIENILLKYAEEFEDILLIDIHTGYGKKGHLHLLSNGPSSRAAEIFKENSIDSGDKENFYKVTGGFVDFCEKRLGPKLVGVYFEFGTLDSQKIFGSINMAYRMVRENYLFRYTKNKNFKFFTEMFYPSSKEWREGSQKNFMALIKRAMSGFLSE